jgi:molybdopterin-guanine dinucleotide biosynthesis adapter protein
MPPIVSVVGKSNSGKTTLIEKLIPELKKRGYKIGIVKHAHQAFDMDREGKDSWRHQKAGADTVVVASPDGFAMVKKELRPDLDSLAKYFSDMDIVITEGFKREHHPKIEVFRSTQHKEPLCLGRGDLVAFVSDIEMGLDVPAFGLSDVEKIADFIEIKFLYHKPGHPGSEKK